MLTAILIGLAVVGGGAYYFMHQQTPSPTLSDNNLDNSQTLPTTNTPAQTTTFQKKTYTNSQYSFAVDYSTKLKFEAPVTTPLGGNEIAFDHNTLVAYVPASSSNGVETGSLNFNVSSDPTDLANCLVDPHYQDVAAYTPTTVTINGVAFFRYTVSPDEYRGGDISTTYYKTRRGNTCYGIVEILQNSLTPRQTAIADSADKAEVSGQLDPVIQSFRFTASAQSATSISGTSKYTDSQYPFAFSYPSTFVPCANKTACVQYSADSQATFSVSVDPSETYEDCTAMRQAYYGDPATVQTTINGITFEKDSSVDPAAGQRDGTESYRTYYNGACYSVNLHVLWSVANQTYPDTMYPKLEALLPSFTFTAPQTASVKHSPPAPAPKTYNGPQLPVSFQYPGELSIDSMSSTGRLYLTKQPGDERNGTITIGDWTKDYPTLAAIEAGHPDEAFAEQFTSVMIGGEAGVQVIKNSNDTRPSTNFYVAHNGKVYGIMVIETYPSELQNFLSTFKFTN